MLSANFKPRRTAAALRAVSLQQHGFLVVISSSYIVSAVNVAVVKDPTTPQTRLYIYAIL